jgi:hypothetical protein
MVITVAVYSLYGVALLDLLGGSNLKLTPSTVRLSVHLGHDLDCKLLASDESHRSRD